MSNDGQQTVVVQIVTEIGNRSSLTPVSTFNLQETLEVPLHSVLVTWFQHHTSHHTSTCAGSSDHARTAYLDATSSLHLHYAVISGGDFKAIVGSSWTYVCNLLGW